MEERYISIQLICTAHVSVAIIAYIKFQRLLFASELKLFLRLCLLHHIQTEASACTPVHVFLSGDVLIQTGSSHFWSN